VRAHRYWLHTCDRSPILELDPDREIVAIDVERDLDILRVQIRTGRIILDEIGAQQIAAFAQACLPQFVAIEAIAESGVLGGNLDRDQAPGGA
jgi:hypothetical protein